MTDQLTRAQREALETLAEILDHAHGLADDHEKPFLEGAHHHVRAYILNSTPVPNVGAMADALGKRLRKNQAVFLKYTTLVDLVRAMLAAAPTRSEQP